MSKGLNKVILIGRLGKDPELKYSPEGTPYCNFSLATDFTYKDKEGKKVTQTEWHYIIAWRKLAELCHTYLKKGNLIYCEGSIKYDTYEKEKVKVKSTKIVITDFSMLEPKKTETEENNKDGTIDDTNEPDDIISEPTDDATPPF